jgi:hypothetical protein
MRVYATPAVPVISFGHFLQMPESCNGMGGSEVPQLKFLHIVVFFFISVILFLSGEGGGRGKCFVAFRNYTVTSEGKDTGRERESSIIYACPHRARRMKEWTKRIIIRTIMRGFQVSDISLKSLSCNNVARLLACKCTVDLWKYRPFRTNNQGL